MENEKRKAAVVGMFDGVHLGHRYLLSQLQSAAIQRGLTPIVVTFPHHPLEIINPPLAPKLLSEPNEKLRLLESCGFSDRQVVMLNFDEQMRKLSAREFIAMLRDRFGVSAILRGFNNRFGTERHLTPSDYRQIGAEEEVEIVDATGYSHPIDLSDSEGAGNLGQSGEKVVPSSSLIRELLLEGELERANMLLGAPYPLEGVVKTGQQIGRRLGFPTANVEVGDASKLIPADGVYAVAVYVAGNQHPHRGMLNIGTRPTIGDGRNRSTIEVNILDFEGYIYDSSLRLEFFKRMRGEIKFGNLDALREQLAIDRKNVVNFFRQIKI